MSVHHPGERLAAFKDKYSWAFHFANFFDYVTQNAMTGDVFIGGGNVDPDGHGSQQFASVADDEELTDNKIHLNGILPVVFGANTSQDSVDQPRMKTYWTGIMGFSIDGFPLVGKIPEDALETAPAQHLKSEWIGAGYGGYGMVNAWLCGKSVAQMLLGLEVSTGLPDQYVLNSGRYATLVQKVEEILKSQDLLTIFE